MAKIIVVEDEQILNKALNIKLLADGHEVLSAENGEAGLNLILQEKPDLVLLDLIMPKMSGFEVLEAVKKNNSAKNIPIIILSNLGEDEDKEKGMKLGATDYYVKSSTDLSNITQKIERLLKK